MQSKYVPIFLWLLALYASIVLVLLGTGEEKFAHLHLVLDTGNAILSLMLAVFLLGEQHAIGSNVRRYLAIGLGFAAATECLHALVGIEWSGWLAWIDTYSAILRPATWPPSTYLLPISLAWTFWLMRRKSELKPALFAAGIALLAVGLLALSLVLPRYVDTGILGIQRPTQIPLLLLWAYVIAVCWRERHTHPLYEGLALMGGLLFLSDLCMLYSTSPHEKFTMMAHVGKLIAYTLIHVIQMRIAAEDSRGRSAAESALRESEANLRNYNEELEAINHQLRDTQHALLQSEKMASIGQLAAGVAHEINNPIGYVYSNLGTLEKYVQDTFAMLAMYEQAEDSIEDAGVRAQLKDARDKLDIGFLKQDLSELMKESKDGITRVKKIVQNLKDFSHVDISDEWHLTDLHQGLDSTLNIVSNEIKYKAEVVREYGDLPEVECLSSQLNQVFMNLLVNAAHAIEAHGTITIRTGRQGDEVWVEIADTGKGIAAEHLKKIFDPFFTTKPIGQGTGLGLSLSYGIVQKHGGRIEVESEVGRGTTFRVWLPVRQPVSDTGNERL